MFRPLQWTLIFGIASVASGAVTVTVTPERATLRVVSQQKFDSTVTGAITPYNLVWTVNGIAGGNAVLGTITADGLYTTPAAPNSPDNRVTVRVQVMKPATTPTGAPTQLAAKSVPVSLQNPRPAISQLQPSIVKPGPFEITLTGSGFLPTTKVLRNKAEQVVRYVSSTQLVVSGTSTDQQIGDLIVLKATNPSPGASGSNLALAEVHTWTQPLMTHANAHSFLRLASFGPTPSSLDQLQGMGIQPWLNDQFAMAPSEFPNTLLRMPLEYSQEHFYRLALTAPDQLRQRVAFALHKIWVVSGVEVDCAEAFIPYYRILYSRAFDNYLNIMRDVALNVAMGEYLDMVNNKKGVGDSLPNENWGRELMQLFTIGLSKLNRDGSAVTDLLGQPQPTYGQAEVLEVTRAFTGWTYPDTRAGSPTSLNSPRYTGPMEPVQRYHDTGVKKLLNGVVVPAGQTAEKDLEDALQNLFNHPNVGPFIGKQLIQQLVTSNPSSGYIDRVAAVFNNNGQGVRGDMKAVVTAVLTDNEARPANAGALRPNAGKLQEPVLFISSMLRALKARVTDHPFVADLSSDMAQRVFYPPSVFSYFSPNYRIPGTQLFGPEFQILSTATAMVRANFVTTLVTGGFGSDVRIDYNTMYTLTEDPPKLVDQVNKLLLGGKMPKPMYTSILTAVEAAPSKEEKVQTALYLTLSSGQYQVDK
ncbi:MAG: DUF1800 family protein [Bryobacteraceae bacterium]